MRRIWIFVLFLLQGTFFYGQICSSLLEPRHGEVNVAVDTPIRWSEIPDIIGFVVSFGTTPGAGDIITNRSSGLNNVYVPETGLPPDTQVYVTIGYYKAGQDFTICAVETFRTEAVTSPPGCTTLVEPLDMALNIDAETKLEWNYAPRATGYVLSIGTTPHGKEVVDNLDVGNELTFDPPDGLPADGPIYVAITPYNHIGKATSCAEESFTTTSVVIDCGPFFDYKIGELVSFRPELDFPGQVGLCENRSATIVESRDVAAGYRWFAIHPDGTETLLSSSRSVELFEEGNYRYEAYNVVTRSNSTVECANSRTFSVNISEIAVISSIDDDEIPGGRRLKINVTGDGNYEYAIDNREGPFQNSAVFENVSSNFHYVYVRDRNGCGTTESSVQRKLGFDDFPKFFTPNGDNVNDFWQYITPEIQGEIILAAIHIFDRYGNPIAVVDPKSRGWDGTYAGRRLPSSDYWFKAVALNGQEISGHFALKR